VELGRIKRVRGVGRIKRVRGVGGAKKDRGTGYSLFCPFEKWSPMQPAGLCPANCRGLGDACWRGTVVCVADGEYFLRTVRFTPYHDHVHQFRL